MSTPQPRKAQTGEPTTNGGHFGSKTNTEPEVTLTGSERLLDHIRAVSADADLPAVMPSIYEAILDRDELEPTVVADLARLTADDIAADYEEHVAKAVDGIEDLINEQAAYSEATSDPDAARYDIRDRCTELGDGDLLPNLIEVVLERNDWNTAKVATVVAFDHADFEHLYDSHIGPALDRVADDLAQRSTCDECGEVVGRLNLTTGRCATCYEDLFDYEFDFEHGGNEFEVVHNTGQDYHVTRKVDQRIVALFTYVGDTEDHLAFEEAARKALNAA